MPMTIVPKNYTEIDAIKFPTVQKRTLVCPKSVSPVQIQTLALNAESLYSKIMMSYGLYYHGSYLCPIFFHTLNSLH